VIIIHNQLFGLEALKIWYFFSARYAGYSANSLKRRHLMKKTLFVMAVFMAFTVVSILPQVQAQEKKNEAPPQMLITNVDVWDGTSDAVMKGTDVLIEGNLIKDISASAIKTNKGATIIDGKGKTLIPGLIDVHTHIAATRDPTEVVKWSEGKIMIAATTSAKQMLLRGFTTARDVGLSTIELARAIDEGIVAGPRILSVGAILSTTSGPADYRDSNDGQPAFGAHISRSTILRFGYNVDGVDEVLKAVRENFFHGAIQIKTYVSGGVTSEISPLDATPFTLEELKAMVEAAERFDTYVLAHTHTLRSTEDAVAAGIKSLEHVSALNDELAKKIKEEGLWVVPSIVHCLTAQNEAPGYFSTAQKSRYLRMGKTCLNALKTIVKYDLKTGFGTDFPGQEPDQAQQSAEFEARAKFWPTIEVLRQATSYAAELIGMANSRLPYQDGPLGVIEEGAYADLLIVDGNPLEDISLLGNPKKNLLLIMKDGEIYKNTL
jgi:imidazolonepropionase-like amidohydrolase